MSSKKIVIVEDDQALYTVYSTELKLSNYNVKNVSDGTEAHAFIKKEKPDLVLLDLMLPGRSGLEILEELKKDPDTKDIKVVMITNFGSEEHISKALELGAEEYIMKYNIVPSELTEKVSFILGEKRNPIITVTN